MVHDFFDPDLLETEYFRRLKKAKENKIWAYDFRNDELLLDSLTSIYEYNQNHAKHYVKRFKRSNKQNEVDVGNCEGIFAEIIVYAYYLRHFNEENIKSLDLNKNKYDLRIEFTNESFHYLEIFSLLRKRIPGKLYTMTSANPLPSLYKKLLTKIKRQKQFTKPRNNFAIAEVNNIDWHSFPTSNDWIKPIFDNSETETKYIRAIILFGLGDYHNRKTILNPNFSV